MHEIVLMGSSQRWGAQGQAASHVLQWLWLSALRMGHRTPDFALILWILWTSGITLLDPLAVLCLMQPTMPLTLTLTTRACCWCFMPSLVFSSTHRSFSIKLLSHWVVSSMSSCLHFSLTRCRIWHFSFLNSMRFLWPHFCCPLRSLWMDRQPSGTPVTSFQTCWRYTLPHHPRCQWGVTQGWTPCVTPGCNFWLLPSKQTPHHWPPTSGPSHSTRSQAKSLPAYPALKTTASL